MVKQVSIGEVFAFVRNGASIKQEDNKSGYPITRIETIWNETIDDSRFGYADIFDKDLVKYEKYLLEKGDILMTHINSPKHLGKSAMYNGIPEKLIHGMNLLCLRPDKKISYSKYLKYYLNSSYFKELLPKISNQSVNQASFSAGNLKTLEIPLPPLPQQQKIANILDAADALKQNDKALIAKYDELTQALFLDMFGDPVSNPKGWDKRKLNDFFDVLVDVGSNGGNDWVSANIKMKNDEDYALMIRTANLSKYDFRNNLKFVSEETYNLFKKTKVYGGEIIMNKIGSAGEFWLMPYLNRPVSLGLNQLMMKFNNLDKVFFYYYFSTNYGKKLISSKLNGATTKSITKTALRDLDILYPPITLQNQFAERVAVIEEQKAIAQKSLEKSESLFNSLLQKAFKGELV